MSRGALGRFLAVAQNTHRESVRQRILYNLVFFAILMTLAGILMGQLSIRQDEKIIKDIGLASMDLFGTLIALIVGVGLVSKEIERRSLYPLLAKPVTRDEFLLGKFVGLGFTLLVNVAAMAAGLFLTLYMTGHGVDLGLLEAIYPIFLGLLLVVALALLFSSVTSSTLAAVFTFGMILAGRHADVIRNMRDVLPGAPGGLVSFLYFLVPNFQLLDLKNRVVYGDPVSGGTLLWLTAYTAAYAGVSLGLALLAFRRRELL